MASRVSKLGTLCETPVTGARHTGTVIFFHGSGGTGDTMKQWVNLLVRKPFEFPHLRVLYPTAPLQPYTPMGGEMSNVWFDREDISPDVPEDLESIDRIATDVRQLIKQENDSGIPTNRIIVGGFSMGGALALHTAFRLERSVAGVFAFSSFLNKNSVVYREIQDCKSDALPPLLQLHGDADDLVALEWGRNSFSLLQQLEVKGNFHTLSRLGHSPNSRGLQLIQEWIAERLPQL